MVRRYIGGNYLPIVGKPFDHGASPMSYHNILVIMSYHNVLVIMSCHNILEIITLHDGLYTGLYVVSWHIYSIGLYIGHGYTTDSTQAITLTQRCRLQQ